MFANCFFFVFVSNLAFLLSNTFCLPQPIKPVRTTFQFIEEVNFALKNGAFSGNTHEQQIIVRKAKATK